MDPVPDTIERHAPAPVRPSPPGLTCRRMVDADIDAAVALLAGGFPERSPDYWRRGLQRMRDRTLPDGFPRYGYVLSTGDTLVGIILILFATTDAGTIRGNVSSWYVAPDYRGFSRLLLSAPLKLKGVTFVNISPAPTTIETIRAQGFSEYVGGTVLALPALAAPVFGVRLRRVGVELGTGDASSILADHAAFGCLCFEVRHDGQSFPFVFQRERVIGQTVSCAQLVYCRGVDEFVRFAGPLGRRLMLHGFTTVSIDANGPIAGLRGVYRAGRGRKFFRGAEPPRLGDLSYSELVVLGP